VQTHSKLTKGTSARDAQKRSRNKCARQNDVLHVEDEANAYEILFDNVR
jgi:hypothetical protein